MDTLERAHASQGRSPSRELSNAQVVITRRSLKSFLLPILAGKSIGSMLDLGDWEERRGAQSRFRSQVR